MFRRPVLSILLVMILVILAGLLAVGAFPPSVVPQPVERAIPNERFGTR
ncbi:hypothetical protein C8P66_112102 [Humitalea rosea]|uniref:Uncharacterized protein n=1 Tax=Humitalea rosea TaxID=990373 RepID=A0A2W7IEB4_9PROT|nr:hypothetical protein [Humitalea rosea]PZW45085.1 hypothetical protein C8P66_112102 [Humitalea rosea]